MKVGASSVLVMTYTMEGFLRSPVGLCQELFPKAPPMSAASSARLSTPCMPETHDQAPAALPTSNTRVVDQSGVDPADLDSQSGVDPTESTAKDSPTAAARVIMEVMCAGRVARSDCYALLRIWPGSSFCGRRS